MDIRKQIGEKIADMRKGSNLSQRDLAERSGLTQNTIYKVENGKFSVGIDTLQRIADVFGKRIDLI